MLAHTQKLWDEIQESALRRRGSIDEDKIKQAIDQLMVRETYTDYVTLTTIFVDLAKEAVEIAKIL